MKKIETTHPVRKIPHVPNQVEPIKPSQVEPIKPSQVKHEIPDEVIAAFNELIQKKWNGEEATVYQNEVEKLSLANFKKAGKKVRADDLYDRHWMDVEEFFEKAGWSVEFDKPAYCESYEAFYVFSKPA